MARRLPGLERSALVGAAVWPLAVFGLGLELPAALLLLAPLVLVPLGLGLVPEAGGGELVGKLAHASQLPAALAAALSFAAPPGPAAALAAAPWMLVSLILCLRGVLRLHRRRALWQLSIDAGHVFLPVGGVFLVLSRLGARPLGFPDEIVLLTAVHFHFAGFVVPLLTGLLGAALRPSASLVLFYRLSASAVLLGVPLLAVGINATHLLGFPHLEVLAAFLLALGVVGVALLTVRLLFDDRGRLPAAFLLLLSAGAGIASMGLACVYAVGRYRGDEIISIPDMAASHGLANALGFCLCGLLGWRLRAWRPGRQSS